MPGGMPDVSGMPKPEGQMMYTGMGMNPMMGGDVQNSFIPAGANNFCCQPPVGVEPCGTTIQAKGPCGVLFEGGLTWQRVRRSDPDVLLLTPNDVGGNNAIQSNLNSKTGLGWYAGAGYLTADGWYGMVTYRKFQDTIQSSVIENNSDTDTLFYIGPGPLGSGQGGNDVPVGGSLGTNYTFNWASLDIMGGTVISPARCLDLFFAGGARITKLQQTYDALINKGDGTSIGQTLYTRLEGAGPRIGMEARVYPLAPLTLYAKAYTSILFTNRVEQASLTFNDPNNFEQPTVSNFSTYTREELLPMLELSVGADVSLFGGRVIAGAAYNLNYLFEAGSTYADQSTNSRAARHVNLTIDGVELHVTLLW